MAETIDIRELNERIERQSAFRRTKTFGRIFVDRFAFRRTCIIGRCAGLGEDFGDQDTGFFDRCQIQPYPVYTGLVAGRCYRYHGL